MWQLDEAQQALVTRYFPVAKAVAYSTTSVFRDRDEALSDSCLGLCSAAYHWDVNIVPNFATYARMCCRNAIMDGWRARNRHTRNAATNSEHLEQFRSDDPSDTLAAEEQTLILDKAICHLRKREQVMVRLSLEGLNNKQVGESLGLKRPWTSLLMGRALKRLKMELG